MQATPGPNDAPTGPDEATAKKAEGEKKAEADKTLEELSRLRLKLQNSTDKDIRAVLSMRIQQIESSLTPDQVKAQATQAAAAQVGAPQAEPAEVEEPEEDVEPPTPEQAREADRLIASARVEKMRGNGAKANELLQQAANVAPGAPTVLEALGDSYMERRQVKAAIKVYKRAFRLAPKNVGLEDKLALAALGLASYGSFENQMRMGSIDSPFLSQSDSYARLPSAILLSAMFPGVGHLVLGRNAQGVTILAIWVACIIWLVVKAKDVVEVTGMIMGKGTHGNMTVLIPVFIMLVVYLGSLASLKSMKETVRTLPREHPKPPVNLPFD